MERTLVQFGDVFRHKEKEYVFLAQTDDLLYAALILDENTTNTLQTMSDRVEKSPRAGFRKTSPVYSFVILQTTEFQHRAAHFAKTDHAEHQVYKLEMMQSLSKEDCKAIKDEICSADSSLPLKLIELVKDLNIQ